MRLFEKKKILRISVLIFCFVMIGIGMLRGEVGTIFAKSIYICLECIGLG